MDPNCVLIQSSLWAVDFNYSSKIFVVFLVVLISLGSLLVWFLLLEISKSFNDRVSIVKDKKVLRHLIVYS